MDRFSASTQLLAHGLALVYHEARHVRHLINAVYLAKDGWERLTPLHSNRVKAWEALQLQRSAAAATCATTVFSEHFSRSLDDLQQLYENPHWRNASAVGGHAWRGVTQVVSRLARALDQGDPTEIGSARKGLLHAKHNNGDVRDKIVDLDRAISVPTDPAWFESPGRPTNRVNPDGTKRCSFVALLFAAAYASL